MDAGDLIFYGLIAISAVASIVKSTKKKEVSSEGDSLPDFKGDVARKIIKTILEEDDDYIPSNPKPVVNHEVLRPKPEPVFSKTIPEGNDSYEKWYDYEPKSGEKVDAESKVNLETYHRNNKSLEKTINDINIERSKSQSVRTVKKADDSKKAGSDPAIEPANFLNPADDFQKFDDVQKALIYGEIMKTKF